MADFKICETREKILSSTGTILVEGGPGSGKTTIALLKAKREVDTKSLKLYQKVLFLSFARATITRIEEQAKSLLSKEAKHSIEINTYHGFCWSIIKTYGYLLYPHKHFQLITPPNLAAFLADVPEEKRKEKKRSMLHQNGLLCFDLFAESVFEIFNRSDKILRLITNAYPVIIVDEFQDTDKFEWQIIKLLGKYSRIIALADIEQRIYDFRGASIARIHEFSKYFNPDKIDLGKENNRSNGTDIVAFGNDLLAGSNIGKKYNSVSIIKYRHYKGIQSRVSLKSTILSSLGRLKKNSNQNDWSIGILVKTKSDTFLVSQYLNNERINHEVIVDPSGPALSALVISCLLESFECNIDKFIEKIINHIRGRKGDHPSLKDLVLAKFLEAYLDNRIVRGSKRTRLIEDISDIVYKRSLLMLDGIPESDWLKIRKLFQDSESECLKNIYEDARYLNLLRKGAVLSQGLSSIWRNHGNYQGAESLVKEALTQEHFSMSSRVFRGIVLMNIHKSKGKEFDEVIIWEEYKKPIVNPNDLAGSRRLLRVGVTRARSFATILTPILEPCILL